MNLKILTPEKIQFDNVVHSLVVPAADGLMGIEKDHAPVVAKLKEGKIVYKDQNKQSFDVEIKSGYLEVLNNQVTILAETL